MLISIITTSFNSAATITDTLQSVADQTKIDQIEHVLIDGGSTDGTHDIINSFDHVAKFISEPDKGIYDAMNKGIQYATGDVIGFLNSDDFFASSDVVRLIHRAFETTNKDAMYGDLDYVKFDQTNKITRKWRAGDYSRENFLYGWMPPHPTFYVKREIFKKFGGFNLSFKTAADYELMLRLLYKHDISIGYIDKVLVKMREGGVSNRSIKNRINANKEDREAWKINGLKPKSFTLYLKPIKKIGQYIFK